jgi:Histidine kinase
MQLTQFLSPETYSPVDETAATASRAAARGVTRGERNPWSVILSVGGLCWLVVAITAVLWMLPWSGTTTSTGDYVITTWARAIQHVMVFVVAVVGYRISIAVGWPEGMPARTRVVIINSVLALIVAAWAEAALALVAGFVDGHMADMRDTFLAMKSMMSDLKLAAGPMQMFLPPYVLGLCAIALVLVADRHHREALRAAELARAYDAARLAMLSAQLQPHFLFNSLHAAMGLIDENPRQASTMLARLGDFLRHALETSHSPWVDVATELAGLEAYFAVQQTRFCGHLDITIDASPESLGVYLPSMLLQPLAENAIEHGRSEGGPALQLRVAASVSAEHLCIVVNNSSPQLCADLTPADYGHGLSNVDLRLRAAYGTAAHLVVGPDQQGGTTAILVLPVRRRPGPGWPEVVQG